MSEQPGPVRSYNRWATIAALAGAVLIAAGIALIRGEGWMLALAVFALGLFLLAKAWPALLRQARKEGVRAELVPNEIGELRVRCPCCGCPSLDALTSDQSCILCEWTVDGLPGQDVQETEELALAQQNFRRFLSVYAPEARPEWSPDPPSEEEVALKQELLARYAEVVRGDPDARGAWPEILRLERRASELETEYSARLEAEAAASAEPKDEDEEEDEPRLPPAAPGEE